MARQAAELVKSMELTNLVWSYAKAGLQAPATFDRVSRAVVGRLEGIVRIRG